MKVGYRTFKHFYQRHACVYWRGEFPHLVNLPGQDAFGEGDVITVTQVTSTLYGRGHNIRGYLGFTAIYHKQ